MNVSCSAALRCATARPAVDLPGSSELEHGQVSGRELPCRTRRGDGQPLVGAKRAGGVRSRPPAGAAADELGFWGHPWL